MTIISQNTRALVQPVYSQNTFSAGRLILFINEQTALYVPYGTQPIPGQARERLWCWSWYLGAKTPNIWGERGSNPPCKKNEICKSGFRSVWDLDFPSLKARGVGVLGVAGHVCTSGGLGAEGGWGGCGSVSERRFWEITPNRRRDEMHGAAWGATLPQWVYNLWIWESTDISQLSV